MVKIKIQHLVEKNPSSDLPVEEPISETETEEPLDD